MSLRASASLIVPIGPCASSFAAIASSAGLGQSLSRKVPQSDHTRVPLISQNADGSSVETQQPSIRGSESQPTRRQNPQNVAMREQSGIARRANSALNHR